MYIKVDTAKEEGTFGKYVVDTEFDGKEDSEIFQVFPHWHEVGGLWTSA